MATITEVNAFKVVNAGYHKLQGSYGYVSHRRSALLNASPLTTDYSMIGKNNTPLYIGAKEVGLPVSIAFTKARAAFDFAETHPGREVWKLHGFATLVKPIDRVLKLNLGWHKRALAFWQAVQEGGDLSEFVTRSAPEFSIAIWGVVRLTEQVYNDVDLPDAEKDADAEEVALDVNEPAA